MRDKLILPLLVIPAIIIVMLVNNSNFSLNQKDFIKYKGVVCIYKNNELVGCNHNLLVNSGKDMILNALARGGLGNITTIAVANNTVAQAATDTSLQGEWTTCGLARAQANEFTRNGYGNWTIAYTWTVTCDNVYVNATGLYNSTGTLFAETTMPLVILYTTDSLKVSWTIWVQ